jgi:hypothetical protein
LRSIPHTFDFHFTFTQYIAKVDPISTWFWINWIFMVVLSFLFRLLHGMDFWDRNFKFQSSTPSTR